MLRRQTMSSTSQNTTNIVAVAHEHDQVGMSIGLFMILAPFWLESKFMQSAWIFLVGEKLTWRYFFSLYLKLSPSSSSLGSELSDDVDFSVCTLAFLLQQWALSFIHKYSWIQQIFYLFHCLIYNIAQSCFIPPCTWDIQWTWKYSRWDQPHYKHSKQGKRSYLFC